MYFKYIPETSIKHNLTINQLKRQTPYIKQSYSFYCDKCTSEINVKTFISQCILEHSSYLNKKYEIR